MVGKVMIQLQTSSQGVGLIGWRASGFSLNIGEKRLLFINKEEIEPQRPLLW